jgi:hypothetical protein
MSRKNTDDQKGALSAQILSGNAIIIIFCVQYVHFMVLVTHV